MKKFVAKTIEEALDLATLDFGINNSDDLIYEILEEKKGLFKRSVTIQVYEYSDLIEYAIDYLKKVILAFEIAPEFAPTINEDIIHIEISTNHNSILIGKNGRTLQALNELVKLALSVRFKKRIRVLLDINDYKSEKYTKVISIAKRAAKEVQRTKVDALLDPMPADERRVIHNALSHFNNIKTESTGAGHHRQIAIKYVE
ncbi:MAG: R3H domain-containing nucleic acid-binding protein [Bacilli bacterium]|jgi:spoIIIJ-associated protein|nr:protein jag [Bacilli bacterium]MDD4344723.1 protein jag [Bacilli bacterium]MDD4520832.1 protein jag [Bacilli bacterium]MDY0399656.1 R3H domain-containing nucleic acid-binding protein [Bacilli bacterium]HKM11392.1 R3H domain-containing nucleic acid-binding protein [Bacilli bacterium]